MVDRLVVQREMGVAMLLSPGFPGEHQQQQPREQQHLGGSSPCQLGHGGGEQRRKEGRKQSLDGKAHIEGHVDTASSGGEVERSIATCRPNSQELSQGSLDEVAVVHLKQEGEGSVGVWCHLHRQE